MITFCQWETCLEIKNKYNQKPEPEYILFLISIFNEYSEEEMSIIEIAEDYFRLFIGNEKITECDSADLIARIKQINRENGF